MPSGLEGGANTAGEGPTAIGGAPAVNPSASKTRFFGTITLDPESAKFQFGQVVDELLMHFTTKSGVKVVVKVDIEAENGSGFDEGTMRTVRENARVLGFGPGTEFE